MIKEIFYCDKCGAEVKGDSILRVHVRKNTSKVVEQKYDICKKCMDGLTKWFDGNAVPKSKTSGPRA